MRRTALVITSILLSAAVLTACGGRNESPPTPASSPPAGQSSVAEMPSTSPSTAPGNQVVGSRIVISNMAYTVPPSVSPGQEVTVVNNDEPNHTVTADENNMFDIRISGGGGNVRFTAPTAPGRYAFHCKYHANMHGVLTVQ